MKKKQLLGFLIVGLMFFFLIALSCVLYIGRSLESIHWIFSAAFYIVSAIIVFYFLIMPILKIIKTPQLPPIDSISTNSHQKNKALAKIVLDNYDLETTEKQKLFFDYKSNKDMSGILNEIFDNRLKQMNGLIYSNAKYVFLSTSISQNGMFDGIASFFINVKLIKDMVSMLGFRPSYSQLLKIYANVLGSAILARGIDELLEEIDVEAIIPALGNIPFINTVTSSVGGGALNAFFTLRIGYITKEYLKNPDKFIAAHARKTAKKQAKEVIKNLIKNDKILKKQEGNEYL